MSNPGIVTREFPASPKKDIPQNSRCSFKMFTICSVKIRLSSASAAREKAINTTAVSAGLQTLSLYTVYARLNACDCERNCFASAPCGLGSVVEKAHLVSWPSVVRGN